MPETKPDARTPFTTTIRLKLLKIGAQIRITVRKVWLSMATSYPRQALFGQAWVQLRC